MKQTKNYPYIVFITWYSSLQGPLLALQWDERGTAGSNLEDHQGGSHSNRENRISYAKQNWLQIGQIVKNSESQNKFCKVINLKGSRMQWKK